MSIISPFNNFLGYLSTYNDLSRSDRFIVTITPPGGPLGFLVNGFNLSNPLSVVANFKEVALANLGGLSMQCHEAELPGKTFATFEARTYGPSRKFPFQTTYPDFTLSFYGTGNTLDVPDSGMWEKRFFDNWMDMINPSNLDGVGEYNFAYRDEYTTNVNVVHYDTNGIPTYGVTYREVYPISVDHIPLAWDSDQVTRLSVTFSYFKWEPIDLLNLATTTLPQPISLITSLL